MSPRDDELRALLAEGRNLAGQEPLSNDDLGAIPTSPAWARRWREQEADLAAQDEQDEQAWRSPSRGRATQTLQSTWIDPEETPFLPVPRPGRALPARLFSLLVAAAIVGLLAWLIVPEVSFRLTNVDTVRVSNGVLTAQPVPLAPTRPATVERLFVDAGRLPDGILPAGTPIARLRASEPDVLGATVIDLSVPFDARFSSVDTLVGAVTLPGTPVATVYDPAKMYVIVTVQSSTLDTLRRGMRARLTSPVINGAIEGTVVSAVPLLGTDQEPADSNLVNVRIQPDDGPVVDLVPGIRFDAAIDLNTAPDGAQPLVFTDANRAPATSGG